MTVSAKVRAAVMKRDKEECQFFCGGEPATEVAHRDHQGAGGLPASHWKNQPPNLAAACGECHSRHQAEMLWEEFVPASEDGPGRMVVQCLGSSEMVPESDLWFYLRHVRDAAKLASKSLQTVGVIDHIIGRMMHDLREGVGLVEDWGQFDQYVSSLGWDPLKANKIADAFEWAGENGGWPDGVPFSKVDLLRSVDFSGLEEMEPEVSAEKTPQKYLELAGGGASYSTLERDLFETGLKVKELRSYLVLSPEELAKLDALVRTQDELGLLRAAAERGLAVLKINAFKGRIEFKRGKDAKLVDKKNPEQCVSLPGLAEWVEGKEA